MAPDFSPTIAPLSVLDVADSNDHIFQSFDFLSALEESGCVSANTGWQPYHLIYQTKNTIEAFLPLYLKRHSWGEYVFDWAWAQAYEHYQLPYYPKLVATIPFTPVPSNKLMSDKVSLEKSFETLIAHCQQQGIHSWHVLYCEPISVNAIPALEHVYERNTVQFHWFNRNYSNFDDFLTTFTARKRKNTRKERASIAAQGLNITQVKGCDISEEALHFFFFAYQTTYHKKGHEPHLNLLFFQLLVKRIGEKMLFIFAENATKKVASALFFYDDDQLYGRYWGCTESYKNLHFELCYYQGIDFCIENNLRSFNPGTQGEHKIQRGFEPVLTYSYHWIKHTGFQSAIKAFCTEERQQVHAYKKYCEQALPFNKTHKG